MSNDVCALICAYNEERTIYDIVKRTRKYVANIVVVNDGSSDRTSSRAIEGGADLIMHFKNKGKGAALKTGFERVIEVGYDSVVVLDADGQHLPEEIPRFTEKLNEGHDIVIGKRDFSNGNTPLVRKIGNIVYSTLLSRLTGIELPDPECGFRGYRTNVLRKIIDLSYKNGFSYESELIAKLVREGENLIWVDISTIYLPERRSKIKPIRHIFSAAGVCLRMMRDK